MDSLRKYILTALVLATGAVWFFSCAQTTEEPVNDETLMTEYSTDFSMIESENGRRKYFFETPLLEGYSLASDPYREFRKGIRLVSYEDDSLSRVKMILTADYAIDYTKRELWEAKGNVVVRQMDPDSTTIYTQQLFWNERTDKVYSNVDTKIEKKGGREFNIAQSFESDSHFKDWHFRYSNMTLERQLQINRQAGADSTAQTAPPAPVQSASQPAAATAPQTQAPVRSTPARVSSSSRERKPLPAHERAAARSELQPAGTQ